MHFIVFYSFINSFIYSSGSDSGSGSGSGSLQLHKDFYGDKH